MDRIYSPFFTKFAEDDLREIADYYLDKNPEYIPRLLQRIEARLEELRYFAEKGRIIPELEKKSITDYRELIEGNYRIIYHIKGAEVFILAIIDGRRNLDELLIKKLSRI